MNMYVCMYVFILIYALHMFAIVLCAIDSSDLESCGSDTYRQQLTNDRQQVATLLQGSFEHKL